MHNFSMLGPKKNPLAAFACAAFLSMPFAFPTVATASSCVDALTSTEQPTTKPDAIGNLTLDLTSRFGSGRDIPLVQWVASVDSPPPADARKTARSLTTFIGARELLSELAEQTIDSGGRSAAVAMAAWQSKMKQVAPLLSELLTAAGVAHTAMVYDDGRNPALVIHRTGPSALSRAARSIFEDHGTIVAVSDRPDSRFDLRTNILWLSAEAAVTNQFAEAIASARKQAASVGLSEIYVSSKGRREETQFLLSPENAIPGTLRVLNSTADGAPLPQAARFAFRTGYVSQLPDKVRTALEELLAVERNAKQEVIAASIRTGEGTWIHSMPKVSTITNTIDGWPAARIEALDVLRPSVRLHSNSKPGTLDLYLMVAGPSLLSPPEVQMLHMFASMTLPRAVNTISVVIPIQTKEHGAIYYIHTLDRHGRTTVYSGDQLLGRFASYGQAR